MIWAILALLGVPLWLIALAILGLVWRNRTLRRRSGDIPMRFLLPEKARWRRGHGLWISDFVTWRGSPASWGEDLARVRSVELRVPDREQRARSCAASAPTRSSPACLSPRADSSRSPSKASIARLFVGRSQSSQTRRSHERNVLASAQA